MCSDESPRRSPSRKMSLQRPESAIFSSRTFVVAFWLFVLVLALLLLANSPLFRLQRVEVLGASLMQEGEIVERAGLQLELPLYAIDLNDAAARLREDPVIVEVRLRRRLPDTIVVTLKERRAVGFLTTREAFWAVDAEAIPLFVTESPSLGLPLITLESPVEPRLGEAIPDARLAEVLQFVGSVDRHGTGRLVGGARPKRRHRRVPARPGEHLAWPRWGHAQEGAGAGRSAQRAPGRQVIHRPHRLEASQESGQYAIDDKPRRRTFKQKPEGFLKRLVESNERAETIVT